MLAFAGMTGFMFSIKLVPSFPRLRHAALAAFEKREGAGISFSFFSLRVSS
jgi:hypothetical protein